MSDATDGGVEAAIEGATDDGYEAAGYIIASDYRTRVLENLGEGLPTPSTIADATGIDITHVSRTLRELEDEGYVELLVPEETRKGRIYGLTEKGGRASRAIEHVQGGASA